MDELGWRDDETSAKLGTLGLRQEILHQAILYALGFYRECGPNEVDSMKGTLLWGKPIRKLRDLLEEAGWVAMRDCGLQTVYHRGMDIAITAAQGNAATGQRDGVAKIKNPRGSASERAIESNYAREYQLALGLDIERRDAPQRRATYWLLINPTETGANCELSLPNGIVGGQVTGWTDRIFLDPVFDEINDVPSFDSVPSAKVKVVRRKMEARDGGVQPN